MKKHADRPCRSPGRGRLSVDERLQVEGLLQRGAGVPGWVVRGGRKNDRLSA